MAKYETGDMVVLVKEDHESTMVSTMYRWLREATPLRVDRAGSFSDGVYHVKDKEGNRFIVRERYIVPLDPEEQERLRKEREKAERKKREELERLYSKGIDAIIEEASALIRDTPDKGKNGIAIHVKKNEEMKVQHGPCHGFIRMAGNSQSLAIVSRVRRRCTNYEQVGAQTFLDYYDWLLNRSPWAHIYITKSAEEAYTKECVALRVDVPANLLQGALICLRNSWEFSPHIELWHELTKKHGVDERQAFVGCMMASVDEQNATVTTTSFNHDHVAISTERMTYGGFKAFCEGTPLHETSLYVKGGSYVGVQKAFIGEGPSLKARLHKAFEEYDEKASAICRNPFLKAKAKKDSGKRSLTFSQYARFLKKFFSTVLEEAQ